MSIANISIRPASHMRICRRTWSLLRRTLLVARPSGVTRLYLELAQQVFAVAGRERIVERAEVVRLGSVGVGRLIASLFR
jgi:hypothetical protein